MKSILKIASVILLVLCFSFAVGCKDKDYVADYSYNEMPTLGSEVEGTESDSSTTEPKGEDNVMDVDDLLNPDKYNEEQSKPQNSSSNSAKPSTGSSSTSGSSSTASSKPSSSSSSQSTDSSKPSSSQSTSSVENDMAVGAEKDTGSYNTPGWIM